MTVGGMDELLEFVLRHRRACRVLGALLVFLGVAYVVGGGFGEHVGDGGVPLVSAEWYREVFVVLLSVGVVLGVLLLAAGFLPRKGERDEPGD